MKSRAVTTIMSLLIASGVLLMPSQQGSAAIFGGGDLPSGDKSLAEQVVSFSPGSDTVALNDGQTDSEAATANMQIEPETKWVLVDRVKNTGNAPLECFQPPGPCGAGQDGSHWIYSVSYEAFAISQKVVWGGAVSYDVTLYTYFDQPPAELIPGQTVYLTANFAHSGDVYDLSQPGVAFQYFGEGISMQPNTAFGYAPWHPDFTGVPSETEATYSFVVPAAYEGATSEIWAGWWNEPPADVVWRYQGVVGAVPPAANQNPVCEFFVTPPDPAHGDTIYIHNTSYDPDVGDELLHLWYLDGEFIGDSVKFIGDVLNWEWTDLDVGTHNIRLDLSDQRGGFAQCEKTVTVPPLTEPPHCVFFLSPPYPTEASILRSDNVSWDPGGGELFYEWTITGIVSGRLTWNGDPIWYEKNWTWPNPPPDIYTITLKVTNQLLESTQCPPQTIMVTPITPVPPPNEDPVCDFTVSPPYPTREDTVSLYNRSWDPDGDYDDLTYTWSVDGVVIGTWENWSEPNPDPGTYIIELAVTDAVGATTRCSRTITVTNRDPVCSFTVTPPNPTMLDTVSSDNTSSDPEGDALTYAWSVDGVFEGTWQDWEWPNPDPGTYTLTLEVEDEWGGSSQCSQTITVTPCLQVMLEHIFNAGVRIGWAQIRAYWWALDAQPPLGSSEANDIIEDLIALREHLQASGFPFENYNAPIDGLIAQLGTGARTLDIPAGIASLIHDPGGLQAQLSGVSCTLPNGQEVACEHIFNAGVTIGWAHIHAYWYALGANPPLVVGTSEANDVIADLTALRAHLQASGFPFVNYDAPIDSSIAQLRGLFRTVAIPEGIGSLMVDPGGLQAQLSGKSCTLCLEGEGPPPTITPAPAPTITPAPNITPTPPLPTRFDWRDQGFVPPVRDQGQCGSCWAFSAAGAVEGAYFAEQNTMIDLSEQDLVSECYPAYGCGGGWPNQALDYIENYGIVDEICIPYLAANSPCSPCADSDNRLWNIDRWKKVTANREDIIKIELISQGPLSVTSLNWLHAVVLVGYDDDSSTCRSRYGQDGCWTIRNSWGLLNGWAEVYHPDTGEVIGRVWHDNGYGYIPYTGHVTSDIIDLAYYAVGVTSP